MEQGDLQKRWKLVSNRLKEFRKCIILPIGSLTMGLCRHRAILFKVSHESLEWIKQEMFVLDADLLMYAEIG